MGAAIVGLARDRTTYRFPLATYVHGQVSFTGLMECVDELIAFEGMVKRVGEGCCRPVHPEGIFHPGDHKHNRLSP